MNQQRTKKKTTGFTQLNRVKLVQGGKEYFDLLLRLIDNATSLIQLQAYIMDDDKTGGLVADALLRAAARKVQVYLMADGYASQVMSRSFIATMKEGGIHFRFFEPLLKSRHFYFGRRMHHKVFVADSSYALVGGINVADRYNDLPGKPAWMDFALYMEGEVARDLCIVCWKTWNAFKQPARLNKCEMKELSIDDTRPTSAVRMRRNDWVRRKNEISSTYIEMFRSARSHIIIMCSYFLPGQTIRRVLSAAARRGVKISIITAGPSDVTLAKNAERWLYDWLLRNKISLYEFQPTVLHAKLAVCDSSWLTIGSYNINDISAYASIELNLEVQDKTCAESTGQLLNAIIERDCIPITTEKHSSQKNIVKQFFRWTSYKLIRLIFNLVTFYYKQTKT